MITNKKQETRNKKQETRNKKQETRNYYDVFSSCQGKCVREGNESSNNDSSKRLQRFRKLQGERNYPCTVRRSINGVFLKIDDMYLDNIGKKIANSVLARYYKGIERDNSNAVLVIVYE